MHTLKLTDVELVALEVLFEGQNEVSCESRYNDDSYPNGRPQSKQEIILDKISNKVSTLLWRDSKINVGKILGQLDDWQQRLRANKVGTT